jgi:hypothetical protein
VNTRADQKIIAVLGWPCSAGALVIIQIKNKDLFLAQYKYCIKEELEAKMV